MMSRTLAPPLLAALLATIPVGTAPAATTATAMPHVLIGDCDGSGCVTVDELVVGVRIAMGVETLDACPALNCNTGPLLIYIDCFTTAVVALLTRPACR